MHVPGPDLEDVGIAGDQLRMVGAITSVTTLKPVSSRASEKLEAFFLKALEGIGKCGVKGATPQKMGPCFLHLPGCFQELFPAFHGTGAGYDDEMVPPILTPSTSITVASSLKRRLANL